MIADDDDDYMPELTPVEKHFDLWLKRDDHFKFAGIRGGKVRACLAIAKGAAGLVAASNRMSPQLAIVSRVAKRLSVPCRIHVPQGKSTADMEAALRYNPDLELVRHYPGYNNVIIARAHADAKKTGLKEVPFGMRDPAVINLTADQVRNIPKDAKRIVMSSGPGATLSGILLGLQKFHLNIPITAIVVGASPRPWLDRYVPGWQQRVDLIRSPLDYHDSPKEQTWDGVRLDPIYESKVIPYLRRGDLFWIVGIRPDT